MFLIASGEAEIEIGHGKHALLKEGDFFGEMALLEHRRRKHDVVAKTRCRVYVLDSRALARLTRRHPEIISRIRKVAESRREGNTEKLTSGTPRKRRARQAETQSEKA